jgi:PilZ domain
MTEDFRVKDVLSLCVDWNSIASSRETVEQFVDAVGAGGQTQSDDRRSTKRKAAMIDVIAVPLNAERKPCGEAFLALTRDISRGGIAILCTEEVKSPYLLLRLEMARYRMLQAVARVIRSRSFYQFTEVSLCFELDAEEKREKAAAPKAKSRRRAKPGSGRRSTKRAASPRT